MEPVIKRRKSSVTGNVFLETAIVPVHIKSVENSLQAQLRARSFLQRPGGSPPRRLLRLRLVPGTPMIGRRTFMRGPCGAIRASEETHRHRAGFHAAISATRHKPLA